MAISTRFSVGIHILTLIDMNPNEVCTSAWIAGSVNTNPVVIRQIMGMLKKAGMIESQSGVPGARMIQPSSQITCLDVYKAVNVVPDEELFNIHDTPNPDCIVGKNIQAVIEPIFNSAQKAMEKVLNAVTIDDIIQDIRTNETILN